jgi:16S rRNA (guanine527-N7)-methyltransferase
MSKPLSPIPRQHFAGRIQAGLRATTPEAAPDLSPLDLENLWIHYQELCRWNGRLSLVGPAAQDDLWSRHYGESLAALVLLDEPGSEPRQLVDLGSGGGFPGLVLAAVRPHWTCTLVEARERKWAFLSSVARKASLPCRCLNARVSKPLPTGLPAEIDILTMRALRLADAVLEELAKRLSPRGRLLLWQTEARNPAPRHLSQGRALSLRGSEHRMIVEYLRRSPPGAEEK